MSQKRQGQKIVFVTGKGGVGKSTVAAAMAHFQAKAGKKVLLVELGEVSYYKSIFACDITYKPSSVTANLDVALWGGDASLREFLLYYVKLKKVVDLFFDNKVMKAFVRAAPALKELALLGKITSGLRGIGPELPYDLIVVDAFATGHFRALLKVPQGMGEVVKFGPMGEQCRSMTEILRDRSRCKMVIVSLLEGLPVSETLELNSELKNDFSQEPEIVANKFIELPLTCEQLEMLTDVESLDFVKYLKSIDGRQQQSISQLQASGQLVEFLPFIFEDEPLACIEQIAAYMESQWKKS